MSVTEVEIIMVKNGIHISLVSSYYSHVFSPKGLVEPGGAQDFLTPGSIFFSNPSRKFDVTSGPKTKIFSCERQKKFGRESRVLFAIKIVIV